MEQKDWEKDWLVLTDFDFLLSILGDQPSKRKLRMFAIACCRANWHLINDEKIRQAIATAEEFADEQVSEDDIRAINAATEVYRDGAASGGFTKEEALAISVPMQAKLATMPDFNEACARDAVDAAVGLAVYSAIPPHLWHSAKGDAIAEETCTNLLSRLASLLRDIFGNPFRPVTIDPAWRKWHDAAIVRLARRIYDERRFADMPILADALEEAGCTNASILDHCRGREPHVRGCWVVDLVLDRA